jgi:hypothetical protein
VVPRLGGSGHGGKEKISALLGIKPWSFDSRVVSKTKMSSCGRENFVLVMLGK